MNQLAKGRQVYLALIVAVLSLLTCVQSAVAFNEYSSYRGVLPLNGPQLQQVLTKSRLLNLKFDRTESGHRIYSTNHPDLGREPLSKTLAEQELREVAVPSSYLSSSAKLSGRKVYSYLKEYVGYNIDQMRKEVLDYTVKGENGTQVTLLPISGKELQKLLTTSQAAGFKKTRMSRASLLARGIESSDRTALSERTQDIFGGIRKVWEYFKGKVKRTVLFNQDNGVIVPLDHSRYRVLNSSQLLDLSTQKGLLQELLNPHPEASQISPKVFNELILKYVARYKK